MPSLAVVALSPADQQAAARLSASLGLPLLPTGTDPRRCKESAALLTVGSATLALQITGKSAPGPVAVDFGAAAMRHRRRAGHNELLGRAVGIGKRPDLRVIDATAGLGRDGFILADLGCMVTLCERNPVVARLLAAGLEAAQGGEDHWLAGVSARMQLHSGPAQDLDADADVIYLDPMFPQRDKSAAVKKEMAVFQLLLQGEPNDADQLLAWALSRDVARVVVKRPPRAPELGGLTPSHSITGKAVRYDVHVRRSLRDEL